MVGWFFCRFVYDQRFLGDHRGVRDTVAFPQMLVWNLIQHSILEMAHLQKFEWILLVYKKALYSRQWWLLFQSTCLAIYSTVILDTHSLSIVDIKPSP